MSVKIENMLCSGSTPIGSTSADPYHCRCEALACRSSWDWLTDFLWGYCRVLFATWILMWSTASIDGNNLNVSLEAQTTL